MLSEAVSKNKNIMAALLPFATPLKDLRADAENAKKHDRRSIEAIKESLQKFGQRRLLVVRKADKVVVAGNGMLQAMLELKWKTAAAILVDDSRSDSLRYAIADNRTAEFSVIDYEQLENAIREICASEGVDVGQRHLIGFTADEFAALLPSSGDVVAPPRVNKPLVVKKGEELMAVRLLPSTLFKIKTEHPELATLSPFALQLFLLKWYARKLKEVSKQGAQ